MLRICLLRSNVVRNLAQKRIINASVRSIVGLAHRRKLIGAPQLFAHAEEALPFWFRLQPYAGDLPNHTKVVLPALSPTMEEGTIVTWAKKEGDKLNEGDLLAEIETDKATMAFETPEEGYLAKILIPAGTKGIPIGVLVCIIVENEADIAAFKDYKVDVAAQKKETVAVTIGAAAPPAIPIQQAPPPPPKEPQLEGLPQPSVDGRVYASPMAKRLAEQRKLRLQGKGSGLFGSITSSDLNKMAEGARPRPGAAPAAATRIGAAPRQAGASAGAYIDIPTSNMRATIAKRLAQSASTIPHFYLAIDVNIDVLNRLRAQVNKEMEREGVKISVNDFVVKAVAMANLQVPEANSYWMETAIRQFANVDVSIAVATETGLITPIVFEANRKGVVEISKEVKALAAKARQGKLQPHEFQGGTVTVSNLGMFDVNFFTAIINPPQSLILAIGSGKERLIEDPNSPKGKSSMMIVTMSCDHRVIDGAVAARWAIAFRKFMEEPARMVL